MMEDPKNNETVTEQTPLIRGKEKMDTNSDDEYDIDSDLDGSDDYVDVFSVRRLDIARREFIAADRLSSRLLAIDDDDDEMEDLILHETLNVDMDTPLINLPERADTFQTPTSSTDESIVKLKNWKAEGRLIFMTSLCVLACGLIIASFWVGADFIGPPNQPTGPYQLIERQEGNGFLGYYTYLEGPDSVGSNGYINYVGERRAKELNIANISYEVDELDQFYRRRVLDESDVEKMISPKKKKKPFLYLKTAPTEAGPRESIRLEGKKRFDRGLFIIDVRHMPAGCGTWPAFWLTDEANWPVNGEIDIMEGVNFQSEAKTALHTSKGCDMFDVPIGTMTGIWDTAVGIPDKKTGIPDMTSREAKSCFVYDPHQWINQGCVAIDVDGGSMGVPLNEKGGGVFVLEWDPIYRHIRSWAFTPHTTVPDNLVQALRTADEPSVSDRVMPNPEEWPVPYGYFPIGGQTNCEGTKFRNMRLVLNTALCGSVAGTRFFMDCKNESKTFKTCNEYINSRPEALSEAYWKIRGVYVYQREWQKAWLSTR